MRAETPLQAAYEPGGVRPVSGLRGTVVIAGRKVLRERGLWGAYEALVPGEHRLALASVTAGEFVPMPLVHAHEGALDALHLPREQARSFGAELSRLVNGVFFSTMLSLAGRLGASPWLVFARAPAVWQRLYRGGAVAVFRRDEGSARVAFLGDPLARYRLHREASGGGLLHAVGAFCARPVVSEAVEHRSPTEFSFLVRW